MKRSSLSLTIFATILFASNLGAQAKEVRSKLEISESDTYWYQERSLNTDSNISWKHVINNQSVLIIEGTTNNRDLFELIATDIENIHQEFKNNFGPIPPIETKVRLITKGDFHKTFQLPSWTNAIYYKGEIIIPIDSYTRLDMEELTRSVKHEYVHALIHRLGNGRVPGWLDEGLAQLAEANVHSSLIKIFSTWLTSHKFIPPDTLAKGFTQLAPNIVPVAYAQSFFSSRELIHKHGYQNVAEYFTKLREGKKHALAFYEAFGETEQSFSAYSEKIVRQTLNLNSG
jgi:hypothetical protein